MRPPSNMFPPVKIGCDKLEGPRTALVYIHTGRLHSTHNEGFKARYFTVCSLFSKIMPLKFYLILR